jgi:KDO2-lipid IV(A) lauroyltransferase
MDKRRYGPLTPTVARLARGLRIANYWLIARFTLGLMRMLRLLPAEAALDFVDRAARRIGPLFGRHRTALSNLRAAYPEKPEAELQAIALDMWSNMSRLAGEYVFMRQLMREDPVTQLPANIDIVGKDLFLRLREESGPHILFTGHMGNFELLPAVAASYGLQLSALFRAPNNPFLAAELMEARSESMGDLVASGRGSAFTLARILEGGGNVGLLVDQKFDNGMETTFFGRPAQTNPLLAKLARQFDCPVHPARCIRLPGNRFVLELQEKLDLPRAADGRVDVPATCQLLNDVVEGWVREHPGQWMWFHRRWEIRGAKRKGRKAQLPARTDGGAQAG